MQYTVCPDCGANLDFGEKCYDCERNKKGSPDPNRSDPKKEEDDESFSNYSISHSAKKIKSNSLRELRISKKIPAKEMIKVVRRLYPKYDKMLQSKCEHGDEYGIDIRYDAMDALLMKYAPEILEAEKRRRNGYHKLTKRISCRLADDEYEKLIRYTHDDGFNEMQAWLTWVVRQYLNSKAGKDNKMEFNTKKAIEAQDEYCEKHNAPNFVPSKDGRCFHCGNNIFGEITRNGYTTGISVESAGSHLITGCPHCNCSFVD